MRRIKETPLWDRPREKLRSYGPSYLTNEELLSVILGSGVKGFDIVNISKKVLAYIEENLHKLKRNYFFLKKIKIHLKSSKRLKMISYLCGIIKRKLKASGQKYH